MNRCRLVGLMEVEGFFVFGSGDSRCGRDVSCSMRSLVCGCFVDVIH